VGVLPVGLSMERFLKPLTGEPAQKICFVGGLDWPPNEVGLRWFVDQVFPRIQSAAPQTRLAVLARGGADRAWLRDHPAVDLVSPNIDATSLFASSSASIAPLMEGGGVRVKILESLAAGCPVVATPIGGEGLALSGLTHTDDPVRFAETCVLHLAKGDPSLRRSVQSNVAAVHDVGVVARNLVGFWTSCERTRTQTSRRPADDPEPARR
jgi:hypothetical protein